MTNTTLGVSVISEDDGESTRVYVVLVWVFVALFLLAVMFAFVVWRKHGQKSDRQEDAVLGREGAGPPPPALAGVSYLEDGLVGETDVDTVTNETLEHAYEDMDGSSAPPSQVVAGNNPTLYAEYEQPVAGSYDELTAYDTAASRPTPGLHVYEQASGRAGIVEDAGRAETSMHLYHLADGVPGGAHTDSAAAGPNDVGMYYLATAGPPVEPSPNESDDAESDDQARSDHSAEPHRPGQYVVAQTWDTDVYGPALAALQSVATQKVHRASRGVGHGNPAYDSAPPGREPALRGSRATAQQSEALPPNPVIEGVVAAGVAEHSGQARGANTIGANPAEMGAERARKRKSLLDSLRQQRSSAADPIVSARAAPGVVPAGALLQPAPLPAAPSTPSNHRASLNEAAIFRLFERLNTDNSDTVLTGSELDDVATKETLRQLAPGLLRRLGGDGDGGLTQADFLAAFDANGNGDISVLELLNGARALQKRSRKRRQQAAQAAQAAQAVQAATAPSPPASAPIMEPRGPPIPAPADPDSVSFSGRRRASGLIVPAPLVLGAVSPTSGAGPLSPPRSWSRSNSAVPSGALSSAGSAGSLRFRMVSDESHMQMQLLSSIEVPQSPTSGVRRAAPMSPDAIWRQVMSPALHRATPENVPAPQRVRPSSLPSSPRALRSEI